MSYFERFSGYESVPRISSIRLAVDGEARVLSFVYNAMVTSIHATRTSNAITLARDEEGVYVPMMVSKGDRDAATTTGAFIRKIVIRWSTEQGKSA